MVRNSYMNRDKVIGYFASSNISGASHLDHYQLLKIYDITCPPVTSANEKEIIERMGQLWHWLYREEFRCKGQAFRDDRKGPVDKNGDNVETGESVITLVVRNFPSSMNYTPPAEVSPRGACVPSTRTQKLLQSSVRSISQPAPPVTYDNISQPVVYPDLHQSAQDVVYDQDDGTPAELKQQLEAQNTRREGTLHRREIAVRNEEYPIQRQEQQLGQREEHVRHWEQQLQRWEQQLRDNQDEHRAEVERDQERLRQMGQPTNQDTEALHNKIRSLDAENTRHHEDLNELDAANGELRNEVDAMIVNNDDLAHAYDEQVAINRNLESGLVRRSEGACPSPSRQRQAQEGPASCPSLYIPPSTYPANVKWQKALQANQKTVNDQSVKTLQEDVVKVRRRDTQANVNLANVNKKLMDVTTKLNTLTAEIASSNNPVTSTKLHHIKSYARWAVSHGSKQEKDVYRQAMEQQALKIDLVAVGVKMEGPMGMLEDGKVVTALKELGVVWSAVEEGLPLVDVVPRDR